MKWIWSVVSNEFKLLKTPLVDHLTWRRQEQASTSLHPQRPGGSSYWPPNWIRFCPCHDETLELAPPLWRPREEVGQPSETLSNLLSVWWQEISQAADEWHQWGKSGWKCLCWASPGVSSPSEQRIGVCFQAAYGSEPCFSALHCNLLLDYPLSSRQSVSLCSPNESLARTDNGSESRAHLFPMRGTRGMKPSSDLW